LICRTVWHMEQGRMCLSRVSGLPGWSKEWEKS